MIREVIEMLRDFSNRSKQEILTLVSEVENSKICDFTDWVGDRWLDFSEWIGQLNIRNYLNNVNLYHRKVIDKNNTSKSTIEKIFTEVNNVDKQYSLAFKDINIQLKFMKLYIEKLEEISNPLNGQFNSEYMSFSLDKILDQYSKYLNSIRNSANEKYPKIIEFDVTSLFLESRDTSKDALALGWTSDWLKNLTSLIGISENVNEDAIRKSIEALISEILVNQHDAQNYYENLVNNLKPEETEIGTKIIKLFVKTGKIHTKNEIAKILGIDIRTITDSDYLNFLCQSDNLEFLNKISDKIDTSIGAYGDAVDTLEISTQILTKVFNDYTEDIEYLTAIKEALTDMGYDNEAVNKVVDKMLWEYQNQYISAAYDGIEKLIEIGIDKGTDKILPLLDVFINTKDISSSVIGLKDTTDDIANIYATQQYSYSLVEKYEFYRQKINSGSYTQNDVNLCEKYFKLAKAAKLQEYKSIKTTLEKALNSVGSVFVSSEDKQYTRDVLIEINKEIERLESLNI